MVADNGESFMGQFLMGQRTGGLALGAKAKGSGTGKKERRHTLSGESLSNRHN